MTIFEFDIFSSIAGQSSESILVQVPGLILRSPSLTISYSVSYVENCFAKNCDNNKYWYLLNSALVTLPEIEL